MKRTLMATVLASCAFALCVAPAFSQCVERKRAMSQIILKDGRLSVEVFTFGYCDAQSALSDAAAIARRDIARAYDVLHRARDQALAGMATRKKEAVNDTFSKDPLCPADTLPAETCPPAVGTQTFVGEHTPTN